MKLLKASLWVFGLLFLWSCQTLSQNKVKVTFEHKFKNENFNLYQKYVSPHDDTIILTKLQYYVSNIKFKDKKGKTWEENNSYYLIKLDRGTNLASFEVENIDLKNISQINFAIGIDKKQNHQGEQKGVLNPSYGMFWTWSQGYIFFKTEGYYLNYPKKRKGLVYHIGHDESYREVTLELDRIDLQSADSQVFIKTDVSKLFGQTSFIGRGIKLTNQLNHIMGGKNTSKVADNYSEIFFVE